MKKLFCYLENCLGCKSCELACAVEHSKKKDLYSAVKEKPLPKQRVFVQSYRRCPYPLQCRHCEEPACVSACMSAAIIRDLESGVVTIDEKRCVGCGMCIMSCPFGALIMNKEEKISLKCDLCFEKDEPACAAACPTKSLFFGTWKEFKACKKKP